MVRKCELCNLEKKTNWYYESENFIVCDCETCKCPMIVLKRHDNILNQEEIIELSYIFSKFGNMGKLDLKRKKIPGHWHIHLR